MNLQDRSIKFLVYKHTCPNGKMYVGITSRSVSERWGKYGYRYKKNRHFWNAIMKYGWDNIKHEILATNLTLEEAGKLEQSLIQQYQLMDRRFGYNNTSGGEVGFPSDEVRVRLKQIAIEHSQDPEFCKKISNGLKGHIVTEECKRKISLANRGRKYSVPSPLKGRKWSEERKAAIRGRSSWCKGLTKETSDIIHRYSEKLKAAKKQKFIDGYQPIWINNGTKETLIDINTCNIPTGWVRGRLNRKYKYIYKEDKSRRISESDVGKFLSEGWKLGRNPACRQALKRCSQRYVWLVDGKPFNTAQAVADYLHTVGFPDIVDSTITNLYIKGFDKSTKYCELQDRIVRKDINNEGQI